MYDKKKTLKIVIAEVGFILLSLIGMIGGFVVDLIKKKALDDHFNELADKVLNDE